MPARRPPGIPNGSFVGRKPELAYLHAQLARARTGEPRLVLVEGPAGIGKTALVRQFLDHVGGAHVLRASGEETEADLRFGVLAQLAACTASAAAGPLATPLGGRRPVDPLVAGAALIDLLDELQRHGQVVVLALDDAHWADEPSLHALTFALRRLRIDRILALILTREQVDQLLPGGLLRVLAGDHGLRLRLAGLDVTELRALGAQLGIGRLPRRAVERLREHTGGNPLHASALLEELPAESLWDADVVLPAPRSFALLVLARLAGCPAETQRLVAAASVLGRSCPLHLAARLAVLDDPLPALESAVAARLLQERPTSGLPLVAFAHPLVHAAVYQDLGPARRAHLHARAVTLVVDDNARLWHRLCAAGGPDPRLAEDLAASARRHAAAGLWGAAAEQLGRAVRLVSSGGERERLTVEAVEALLLDGQIDEAATLVAELADSVGPATRLYVLGSLAMIRWRARQAWALLTEAWRRCDRAADPGLAARIAVPLTDLCVLQARGADAARWGSQALELAEDTARIDFIRFVHVVGLAVSGAIDQALALAAALPEPPPASLARLDALLGRGLLRTWTNDPAGAVRDLGDVVATCQDRSVLFRLLATSLLGQAEYNLGRWDDAEVHSAVAVSLARNADQTWLASMAHALAALVPAARGQWERAATHVRAAYDSTMHAGPAGGPTLAASAHAHLAAARAEPEEVVMALRPLLDLHEGNGEPAVPAWRGLLVEALITLGEHDQAEAVLVAFETLAATCARHSILAAASRARGQLHAARHETAAAAVAFEAGLEHATRVMMPFERARLELAHGAFLRRAGKRALAAAQLEAARATLWRLDARPWLEHCERELTACGIGPAARRRPNPELFTPRELAVARLVASGLTNRQVARELVVSVKTVEYHLGHVYTKLQVTSRLQLAARLASTRDIPGSVPEAIGRTSF